MMLLFLIIELTFLYLLSRRVIGTLYRLLQMLTRSRPMAIWIVSIIFFPGTVVHELAHLFTAEILGVRTGKLTLVPESLEGNEINAGAVMIAATDPFRRTLIGLAPVYVGIIVLVATSSLTVLPILTFYIMFAVSNSMFSSEEDMKVRVVKSAEATVKLPHIATISPGPAAQGYVTNIEGILNRVKYQVESAKEMEEDEEEKKKAKNMLKKITRITWGQEKQRIVIEDPSGNSAIISDKAVKSSLKVKPA